MEKTQKPFNNPKNDPDGSYTGNFTDTDELEKPVQDVDDL